jgi:uncharacterized protein (TIGR00661 family)
VRILYGVVGEGMGHATRSRVVIEHLLSTGHEVHVVVSGKAHAFIERTFAGRAGIGVTKIAGLHFVEEEGGIDRSATLLSNLADAPASFVSNLAKAIDLDFWPEVVVSDFDSWAWSWAVTHGFPVVSIDNIQVLHRCRHPAEIRGSDVFSFLLARYATKWKMVGAWHYLVTSFFFPPVRKERTSLVPPILRPEVLAAKREPGRHVVVYQHADALEALLPTLRRLGDHEFRVYGSGREGTEGHLAMRPFSTDGFVDDLRTARAVIAGGGFSLMSESVHLGVPMLSVPLRKQAEQELNARWLAHLGYGEWTESLSEEAVVGFLEQLDVHAAALAAYVPRDNAMTFGCLDEILLRISRGESPPKALDAPNLGDAVTSWADDRLDE